MKRTVLILILAVLIPSLLLGGLAFRTASQQGMVLERQAAIGYQRSTDEVAVRIRDLINAEHRAFADTVNRLLTERSPDELAAMFPDELSRRWARKAVGFAVTTDGALLSPTPEQALVRTDQRQFLADNSRFLQNQIYSEVYQSEPYLTDQAAAQGVQTAQYSSKGGVARKVSPKQASVYTKGSQLNQATVQFSQLAPTATPTSLARFVDGRLELLLLARQNPSSRIIFGAMLTPDQLRHLWPAALPASPEKPYAAITILDDRAQPVASTLPGFTPDWKSPFVATEIGEQLPHWEVALYLLNPREFSQTGRVMSLTLILLTVIALTVIGFGTYVVATDTQRQLALAQKKSDFVSNVSHELKSPLTSIRMFAEMLSNGTVADPEKRAQYLRIITLEAERLSRLINNVLDFARLERNRSPADKQPLDLFPVLQRAWEAQEAHLRSQGFQTSWERLAEPPYPVIGNGDALAQILVNLLSNAEKYSAGAKEVALRTAVQGSEIQVSVLDRGLGVPEGQGRKIFEPFHRAHDALSSGIQGSGLGLTIAQRLAAEHGGTIDYRPRSGGGSEFTLRLPLEGNGARA